ncbi:hypothetical protein D9M70_650490 [compost metagenome]
MRQDGGRAGADAIPLDHGGMTDRDALDIGNGIQRAGFIDARPEAEVPKSQAFDIYHFSRHFLARRPDRETDVSSRGTLPLSLAKRHLKNGIVS